MGGPGSSGQGGAGAPATQGERLQKLLAAAGLGSRREIEQWIAAGRVSVDGRVAALGERAPPGADIRIDGKPVATGGAARAVLVYHKPLGEVTTRSDPQGRPTVFDRLPPSPGGRWVVVGRLDVNTSGLLLFTTDGALAHRLMHPSAEVEREYLVRVRGVASVAQLDRLRRGVQLEDGPARFSSLVPASLAIEGPGGSHDWYRVTLKEGRNREVRRLWQAVGLDVSRLKRLRYGRVLLPDDLPAGQWRLLPAAEAALL